MKYIKFLDIFDAPTSRTLQLDLIHSSVDVIVRGFLAHISLDLKYLNSSGKPVEVSTTSLKSECVFFNQVIYHTKR